MGEDGKRYLYVDKGAIAPLSDDGLKVTGPKKTVYEGWRFPKDWKTEGNGDMFLEGPKLLHKDGYYYMVSAEGGTAGTATSHMVVVARSKSVFGPWENSPTTLWCIPTMQATLGGRKDTVRSSTMPKGTGGWCTMLTHKVTTRWVARR